MIRPWAVWSVLQFEFRRTLTWQRLLFVAALALFPVGMISLIQYQGGHLERGPAAGIALFVLIPEVACLMGLLLWATPAIQWEIESKTWFYLAVRPGGRDSILVGKYLAAVAWAILCGWLSLALCLGVLSSAMDVTHLVLPFLGLIVFACLAYGSLYILISVLFLQKAMVAAVAYTAVMEVVIAWIPAVINHFSGQYHLRCLMAKWIDWPMARPSPRFDALFLSAAPAWQHALLMLGATAVLLGAAVLTLRCRELVTARDE